MDAILAARHTIIILHTNKLVYTKDERIDKTLVGYRGRSHVTDTHNRHPRLERALPMRPLYHAGT